MKSAKMSAAADAKYDKTEKSSPDTKKAAAKKGAAKKGSANRR